MSTVLAYSSDLESYRFGSGHPMRPERFARTVELARAWGFLAEDTAEELAAGATPVPLPRASVIAPSPATDAELELAHSPALIAAVRAAGADPGAAEARFGLGPGDTPAFHAMHGAAALAVGATLAATRSVTAGSATGAFAPAGGLHHAHRDSSAGFCVYNDCVIAIEDAARSMPGLRVAYVDIDAHHGDGVQEAFYARADVLTLSVHESGSYLYPGTGHDRETGEGAGRGFALNVPLPPYAGDECYALVSEAVIAPALSAFGPDLIFLQGGADTHLDDPLTHLALSVAGYSRLVGSIIRLAEEHSSGRIVMVGGGGYEPWSAVPRMWATGFAHLIGRPVPDRVPDDWLATARAHVPDARPETFAERAEASSGAMSEEALRLTGLVCDRLRAGHPLLAR